MMSRIALVSFAALASALTSQSVAAPVDPMGAIKPHRAVYDMALSDVAEGSSVATLDGRLVYDLQGTPCDGFTVNFRLVTQFANRDGEKTTTDLRSSTFEEALEIAAGSGRFRFLTRNFVNQVTSDETDGIASREAGKVEVSLKKPEEAQLDLPPDVMFPTEHLGHLIEAARAGTRVFQARIYDGSEDGATVNETTAVIGKEAREDESPFEALRGRSYWPVTLSYFDEGASGDQLPNYEISFNLFENGVSDALTLDYGEFSVMGALSTLNIDEQAAGGPAACSPD